jgi:hypothetical protein
VKDGDEENSADPGAQRGVWSRARDGNKHGDREGEVDTQGGENGTRNDNGTNDGNGTGQGQGKGKGKAMEEGKRKRNGKGKGIVEQSPGGNDISRAIALQLQKEMPDADLEMEG